MSPKATIQRRLFALSGIVPLVAFVLVHLVTTATGLAGAARFDRVFAHRTWTTVAVVVLVMAPLAYHAAYGTYLAIARPGETTLPSWKPGLRRAAALGTLVFVTAHVVELPAGVWTGRIASGSLYDVVSAHLSTTWHGVPAMALLYLLGVAATLTHVALAVWTYLPSAGFVLDERARKAISWGLVSVSTLLFVLAGDTIVFFATGSRLLGPSPPAFVPEGPPPAACSPAP
jgi:succinate dehydrogenase / fumarate reductase cytochrome b subunit